MPRARAASLLSPERGSQATFFLSPNAVTCAIFLRSLNYAYIEMSSFRIDWPNLNNANYRSELEPRFGFLNIKFKSVANHRLDKKTTNGVSRCSSYLVKVVLSAVFVERRLLLLQ